MFKQLSFSVIIFVSLALIPPASPDEALQAWSQLITYPPARVSPTIVPPLTLGSAQSSTQLILADAVVRTGRASAQFCNTYYFHSEQLNVGAVDGEQKIATLAAPDGVTQGVSFSIKKNSRSEIIRFYSDPTLESNLSISDDITGFFWVNSLDTTVTFTLEVFDYDPMSGDKVPLGVGVSIAPSSTLDLKVTFTVPPSVADVPAGHRLLVIFYAQGANNTQNGNFLYDSSSQASQFNLCQETLTALVIDKQVTPVLVNLGDPLTYTIRFTNTGEVNATGSIISDTLPAGTNGVTASLNGSPVTLDFIEDSNTFTVAVNSALAPGGVIPARQSGVLVLQTRLSQAFIGSTDLLNVAAIASTQVTTPITDSAVATIRVPDEGGSSPHRVYLPIVLKSTVSQPQIFTDLYIRSVNTGSLNIQVLDPNNNDSLLVSCIIENNTVTYCGSFYPLGIYKVVAMTENCGVLQGIFNDANVGPVTRTVFCY